MLGAQAKDVTHPTKAADTDLVDDIEAGGGRPRLDSDGLVGKPGQHAAVSTIQHTAGAHVKVPRLTSVGQDGCHRGFVEA